MGRYLVMLNSGSALLYGAWKGDSLGGVVRAGHVVDCSWASCKNFATGFDHVDLIKDRDETVLCHSSYTTPQSRALVRALPLPPPLSDPVLLHWNEDTLDDAGAQKENAEAWSTETTRDPSDSTRET